MTDISFNIPVTTRLGAGIMESALRKGMEAAGKNIMLAYGMGSVKRSGLYGRITGILESMGKNVIPFGGIMPNPTWDKVLEGARIAGDSRADFILAVGGGSVSDCAKMIAVQAMTGKDVWTMETEEGMFPQAHGHGSDGIPVGVIATIAGTGSEQNNDAVITHTEKKIKTDLYGQYPVFAILDPTLTLSVPMDQFAAGAFDSLSHVMETYFGKETEVPLSDSMSEAVMRDIIGNLRKVIQLYKSGKKGCPEDIRARGLLMWDSAMAENGLLKIGKKTDFQCHMIEHQLGAYTDCSHGKGLAVLHPAVYGHMLKSAPGKFARFAAAVWGIDGAGIETEELAALGIDALRAFIRDCGLPLSFGEMGLSATLTPEILRKIAASAIIREGCARTFTPTEILSILEECM